MKTIATIAAGLILAGCATMPATSKNCMGAHPKLCAFAAKHNLTIISGYRRNARIAGTRHRSNHASGRAIDAKPRTRRVERAAHRAGFRVGWYCGRMRHIHIEMLSYPGQQIKTWYKGCRRK